MTQALQQKLEPLAGERLAKSFSRAGWIGFWLQIAIGSIPFLLAIYALLFDSPGFGTRGGLALIRYLSIVSMLLLVVTTIWSYRYTRLAKRMADPKKPPSVDTVRRTVWTGIAASTLGIVFSILVMMFEVAQLLIYFLRAPQGGVPVIQTTAAGSSASWVSAGDMMSLLGLILASAVEVVVLALSLWLLLRATSSSAQFRDGAEQVAGAS
jgi:hypothetical protein